MQTVIIPSVEILRTGRWMASTGPIDVTDAHLASILEASRDTEMDLSPVKLGHIDPRFDGQPAFGWVRNLRVTNGRMIADLMDVPAKLAEIAKVAYKRRSAELRFNQTTASGKTYPCSLHALSLLGVTPPAVKGMSDLLGLFSEGSSAQDGGVWVWSAPSSGSDVVSIEQATTLSEGDVDTDPNKSSSPKEGVVPIDEAQLREMLGVDGEADVVAALKTKLAEVETAKLAAASDPNVLRVSKEVWETTQADAIAGAAAAKKLAAIQASSAVSVALAEARIGKTEVDLWTQRLTDDFDGESVRLSELPKGSRFNTEMRSDARTSTDLSESPFTDEALAAFLPAYKPVAG